MVSKTLNGIHHPSKNDKPLRLVVEELTEGEWSLVEFTQGSLFAITRDVFSGTLANICVSNYTWGHTCCGGLQRGRSRVEVKSTN